MEFETKLPCSVWYLSEIVLGAGPCLLKWNACSLDNYYISLCRPSKPVDEKFRYVLGFDTHRPLCHPLRNSEESDFFLIGNYIFRYHKGNFFSRGQITQMLLYDSHDLVRMAWQFQSFPQMIFQYTLITKSAFTVKVCF